MGRKRSQRRTRSQPLRNFRKAQKPPLSQWDAARRFGISQAAWSRYERGEMRPNPKLAKRLVQETGVSVEWLMGMAS